jgi:hypothetical protein
MGWQPSAINIGKIADNETPPATPALNQKAAKE